MATLPVTSQGRGFTLIEFLVAAFIGVMAMSVVGATLISAQRVADEKSRQLYLLQSLTSAFQTIEQDIQRAGFSNYQGDSLTLAAAVNVIELRNSSDFGLAYYRLMNDGKHYRAVRYYLDDDRLVVCEQGATDQAAMKSLLTIASCRSMLDEKRIQISAFSISAIPLANSAATSALYRLSISANTADLRYKQHLEIDVKQRNWQ